MIDALEVILWVVTAAVALLQIIAVVVGIVAFGMMGWQITHTKQIAQIWPPHSQYHKEAMREVKLFISLSLIFVPVLILVTLVAEHPLGPPILLVVLFATGFGIGFKRGMREDAEVLRVRKRFEQLQQEARTYLDNHPEE